MKADADLIAGGMLIEPKTTARKPPSGVTDVWQLLGYALMDYSDEFGITDVAMFSMRHGHLAQWGLEALPAAYTTCRSG
jgi:hypothetical protein